jgi:hypothetical protein
VAELILPAGTAPCAVLDVLFEAINGPPSSPYHGKVERQTRCVTVYYVDGMHLDITPTLLVDERDPCRSILFHAKPSEPASAHRRLLMNSFAFCEWFNERTPVDLAFARAYGGQVKALEEARASPKRSLFLRTPRRMGASRRLLWLFSCSSGTGIFAMRPGAGSGCRPP